MTGGEEGIKAVIAGLGLDPDDAELVETPGRYMRAMREMTGGYQMDPAVILGKTFPAEGAGVVTCRGIHFAALCQHHLLPFTGTVSISYLPAEKIIGLSKLARLVECRGVRQDGMKAITEARRGCFG